MDSNYSLRFHRTSREAFGHDAKFHDADRSDRIVFFVCALCAAFLVGMIVGGMQ